MPLLGNDWGGAAPFAASWPVRITGNVRPPGRIWRLCVDADRLVVEREGM